MPTSTVPRFLLSRKPHLGFFFEAGKKVVEFNLCWKEKGSDFCTDSIYTDGPETGRDCSGDHCCCSSSHFSATAAAAELASALLKATATEAAGGGPTEEAGGMERKMNREDGVLSLKRDVNSLLHFALTTRMGASGFDRDRLDFRLSVSCLGLLNV